MGNDIEIEIKVRVENSARLIGFLHDNAKFEGEFHQIDHYFNTPHRNFDAVRPINEWLRLRESAGHDVITYKMWHRDDAGNATYADEYETTIGNLATMRKIFAALGFTPLVKVEKNRRIWRYRDYEVAIDRVANLGDFIEIEYKGADSHANHEAITAGMFEFLRAQKAGSMEQSHQGYAMMMLHPEETVMKPVR